MHRVFLLRAFGASIGRSVVIKPGVRVKFPWRLEIGDYCWIGEDVWIDNLARVTINANCCLSQGSYLCTGSHDWTDPAFSLIMRPITIAEGVWLCAKSVVGPGVSIDAGAVLGLGAVATNDLDANTIYQGVPAVAVKRRDKCSA